MEVFEQQQQQFPHLTETFERMKAFYNQKLWHELGESLLIYIRDPIVLQQGSYLISFYDKFLHQVDTYIDQITFARYVLRASEYFNSPEESIFFIDKIIENSIKDEEAAIILELKKSIFILQKGDQEGALKSINDVKQRIRFKSNLDPLIFSNLYKVSFLYSRERNNLDEFYTNALQYLAFTKQIDLQENEKQNLSLEMTLALLISPYIYNFSELIEQPLLQSLKNTQNGWLFEFLQTFNSGSIDLFNKDKLRFKSHIAQSKILQENERILEEKSRIMALLDLIFNLQKSERNVSFQQISNKTQVALSEVELLVMRAMALGLIKGKIDQLSASVEITWITPRVLDQERVQVMRDKFENWQHSLEKLKGLLSPNQ